jgi:hypothetical protein
MVLNYCGETDAIVLYLDVVFDTTFLTANHCHWVNGTSFMAVFGPDPST